MINYVGGQINQEHRGELALVLCATGDPNDPIEKFLYSPFSEEFVHITGVRAVKHFPQRVYCGVSKASAEKFSITRTGKNLEETLNQADRHFVNPYFLSPYSDQ